MTTRAGLLNAHIELTAAIRASEPWEKSYTDSPATFKRLVRQEAVLQARANEYLLGLRDRAAQLVNWSEVKLNPIQAAATLPDDHQVWNIELATLTVLIEESILELTTIGAQAGEDIYSRTLGFNNLSEAVIKVADKHTAHLVSQVTKTTKSYIQRSIKQSIAAGEGREAAIERIQKKIASPVRAEMIAQTESVNAYQSGLDVFGEESGVTSWTWDALIGACKLCSPLDGVTHKVGVPFVLPNGTEVLRPAAHTRCRCGRIANY